MNRSENDGVERRWSLKAPTARTQREVDRIFKWGVIMPGVCIAFAVAITILRVSSGGFGGAEGADSKDAATGSGRFQVAREAVVRDSFRHDPMVLYRVVDTRTSREYLLINGPSRAVVVEIGREGRGEGPPKAPERGPEKIGEEKPPEDGEVLRGPFAGGKGRIGGR